MIAKLHENQGERLLAACDDELLGRKLQWEGLYLHVSEHFYGNKSVTREELCGMMDSCSIANLVGEQTVAVAVEKKLVKSHNILEIAGVPHAQFARMLKRSD